MKRLIFLAAYTPDGIVSEALVHEAAALSEKGDVIFCADSEISGRQLDALKSVTVHREASRHFEYDFGSYKRCWEWAKQNLDLKEYDLLYLVNDSVYGPLLPVGRALDEIESSPGLSGMVFNPSRKGCHVQSWFEKVPSEMFLDSRFDSFLESVTVQEGKNDVCVKYETGLTALALGMGFPVGGYITARGNSIYNNVLRMFRKGLPFIKKSAFTRHNGSLGLKVKAVLSQVDPELRRQICEDIDRIEGEGYSSRLMTSDPFKIMYRYLSYLVRKLR